jgi:DNA-binding NarL/FixJ family response regulator
MTARAPIRLLIVDDSRIVRAGLRTLLETARAERAIEVVGDADSVASGVAEAARLRPDVVLLDVRLPDGSGIRACREIVQARPEAAVLMLSSFGGDDVLYEAVVAGAKGFLVKEIDPQRLAEAVENAAEGRAVLTPDATVRIMRLLQGGAPAQAGAAIASLSRMELKVLELLAAGRTNRLIAEALGLSENTVKNYLANVFAKLKVERRTQAAALYLKSKLAAPGA